MHRLSELFPGPACVHADTTRNELDNGPSPCRVVVVESRVMAGELFCYALRHALPDFLVDLVARLDDVKDEVSILFYSFINRGCDLASMGTALIRLREKCPDSPLVVVTDTAGEDVEALMARHAVTTWIPASAGFSALIATVRCASSPKAGGNDPVQAATATTSAPLVPFKVKHLPLGLTSKENEILRYLHEGKSNKVIAHALACSESTVKVHVSNMMRKLRLHNRTQLALVYQSGSANGRLDGWH